MSMKLRDIAILNIKGSDYCCIIRGVDKGEAIKLLQNIDLIEESGALWKLNINNNFWSCKFTSNYNLNAKSRKLYIKKKKKILRAYIKIGKTFRKFGDTEIKKQKFRNIKELFQ